MFGAPSLAWGIAGHAGSESCSVRPIRPANAEPSVLSPAMLTLVLPLARGPTSIDTLRANCLGFGAAAAVSRRGRRRCRSRSPGSPRAAGTGR